ncbi:MAG: WD40 repeat domain-containing protein, partial [Pseudomonadota bacterium]
LCRTTYQAIGGVAGSLDEHADGVLAEMTPAQVEVARQLLLRLVTTAGTRRVVALPTAVSGLGPSVKEVLEKLTSARLLMVRRARGDTGRAGDEAVLELVHESLLRTWKRLARWIEESHEELALLAEAGQAAELWQQRGRRDEEVWHGDALAETRRKLARLSASVPDLVSRFLHAGLRKEQRRRRRKRLLAIGGATFLGAVALVSLLQQRATQAQKVRVEAERARAEEGWSRARQGEAETQAEGASAALGRGAVLEARARLRSSLQTRDSILGRALWWRLHRNPVEWTVNLADIAQDVAYSPDGRSVAVACKDGLVYLIDVDTTETRMLRDKLESVMSVDYSPDGRHLASGLYPGPVRIWDLAAATSRELPGHDGVVRAVAISPDGKLLASTGWDKTVRIWSFPAGKLERVLPAANPVNTVDFSPDGLWLAFAGRHRSIHLYDVRSWTEVRRINGPAAGIIDVAFSPDGMLLASSSVDLSIRLWSTASGEQLGSLTGHSHHAASLAFSTDGMELAAGMADGTVRLWSLARRETVRILTGHDNVVRGVAYGPDGRTLASASQDQTVRLWHVASSTWSGTAAGRRATSVDGESASNTLGQGHDSASWGLSFSPDGRSIASSGHDGTLRLWNVASAREEWSSRSPEGEMLTVSFSPDGKLLASGGSDTRIHFWEAASGRLIRRLPGHENWIREVAYSNSGNTVASASDDRTIRIWDAATGVEKGKLVGHSSSIASIAYSSDDRWLASAGDSDGTIRVWDLASRRTVNTLATGANQTAGQISVVFSPAGRLLFSSGGNGVRRWDPRSGREWLLLEWPQPRDGFVSIDPSGRLLAVSATNEVLLVDTDSGKARTVGRCHGRAIRTAFSPDGRLVAANANDGTIRVWQADRLMPFWRAPVLLPPPLRRLFTHQGWMLSAPSTSSTDWERAVEDRGIYGTTSSDDRLLCLRVAAERLEQWDLANDVLVSTEEVPGLESIQAIPGGGCASLARGEVRIHRRSQQTAAATLLGMTEASVLASHENELLVVAGRQVLVVEPTSATATATIKASYPVAVGVSAVGRVGDYLAVGYRQGQVELIPTRHDMSKPTHTFRGAPSAAVTRLVAGPAETLVGGYGNGAVVLWTLADGAVLESAKLHGPVQHLVHRGDKLYAATEVGQYLIWDLGAFLQDYCELMHQIWQSIPVVWESGLPVSSRSIPQHRCAGQAFQAW